MKLFKHKNPLVMLIYTFWGIASEEAYQFSNAFRETLGLKRLKLKTIKLEDTIAIINSEQLAFQKEIGKKRAEYTRLNQELHEVEYKYYNALSVDEKNEKEVLENIPKITFEEDTKTKYSPAKDENELIFRRIIPKRQNTDEFELIMGLDDEIHDMAVKMGGVNTNQFQKVNDVKPLPMVKREEPKKPLETNKKKYLGRWSALFIFFCLVSIYVAEAIIFQNIFENTIGFSAEKSWACATMIVGGTYLISRRLFTQSERLLGRKKRYPVLLTIFSILFFVQVFTAGILTNYNIRFQEEKEELQNTEDRLRHYQSQIADAYDPSEITELQSKADILEAEVTRRSAELEQEPQWIVVCGYIILGLFSVLTLFGSCILKSLAEQAKYIVKLARRREFLQKRILEIQETYDTEVERLFDANVLRQLFRYHLARKEACEYYLSQAKDLDKDKYIETYRQRKKTPVTPNLNGQMTAQHHTNYSPIK